MVEGNTVVENLYDERSEANCFGVKANSVKMLKDRLAATDKAKVYADNVWGAAVKAKELTKGALSKVKTNKKKTKEALLSLRFRYKKLETEINQYQNASKWNYTTISKGLSIQVSKIITFLTLSITIYSPWWLFTSPC